MGRDPEEAKRLRELERKALELGVDGVFTSGSGKGLSPEAMALEMWKAGYIAVPTVKALLDALDKNLEEYRHDAADG